MWDWLGWFTEPIAETKLMRLVMEWINPYPSYDLRESETIEERRAARAKLLEDMPVLVDNMDNKIDLTYVACPTRVCFIDKEGNVRYDSDLGPYGLSPEDLDAELSKYERAN